jgi:hypothetical protein
MTPDREYLRKVSQPPQSRNAQWDSNRADDGATLGPQRQTIPSTKPTRIGTAHSASISPREALPEDDDVDPTVKALKAIYKNGPMRGL